MASSSAPPTAPSSSEAKNPPPSETNKQSPNSESFKFVPPPPVPFATPACLFATIGNYEPPPPSRKSDKVPIIASKVRLNYEEPTLDAGTKGMPNPKNPFVIEGKRTLYEVKEDDSGLYARVDLPGVDKEGVKLWVDKDVVYVKGEEAKKDPEYDFKEKVISRKYSVGIQIRGSDFKTKNIKALMKDGVLMIVVPKIKIEEKEGVFEVKVN